MPAKQKPRGRLWVNDGSCVRLRPERPNHVWSYDFAEARTHDGRSLRLLTMIDEFTRECLAIRVARRLNSDHVIETLGDCMLARGILEHLRSDNDAEMTARRVKLWLKTVGTQPLFIELDEFAEGDVQIRKVPCSTFRVVGPFELLGLMEATSNCGSIWARALNWARPSRRGSATATKPTAIRAAFLIREGRYATS